MSGHLASAHHPGEFPYGTGALEAMAAVLRARGHVQAAAETEELPAQTLAYMEAARACADRLPPRVGRDRGRRPGRAEAHGRLAPLVPAAPKPVAWRLADVISGRRPERKAHTTLGHTKSAIRKAIWRVAHEDMCLLELDPATGIFAIRYEIPKGTARDQLPW